MCDTQNFQQSCRRNELLSFLSNSFETWEVNSRQYALSTNRKITSHPPGRQAIPHRLSHYQSDPSEPLRETMNLHCPVKQLVCPRYRRWTRNIAQLPPNQCINSWRQRTWFEVFGALYQSFLSSRSSAHCAVCAAGFVCFIVHVVLCNVVLGMLY